MPEENLLIQNEYAHAKVFRAPTGKKFPKNLVFITVLAISAFIIIGGFIFWATHFDQTGEEDETQRQRTVNPVKIQSTKSILLNYLRRISNSKTISGICVYERSSVIGVGSFQDILGVSPGIITTQMPSYTSTRTRWNSFAREVISNWNKGHLVHIQWWYNPTPLNSIRNFTDTIIEDDVERRWGDLIKDGGELNEVWKKELDKIVPYLHKLQTAGVVPIFDIFSFINDKQYIWNGRPGVDGTAKLYQITRDYLTKQHNLTSLIWSWSLNSYAMTHFEEFWPGSDYVDVASVFLGGAYQQLPMSEYDRLINLVGNKPLSMECMTTVPSLVLLTLQPRWTWFTTREDLLEDSLWKNARNIQAILSSPLVVNKENIDFFS